MKDTKVVLVSGDKEYNAVVVSVYHSKYDKKVTVTVTRAIRSDDGRLQIDICRAERDHIALMPRLNQKKLDQYRQDVFESIDKKESVFFQNVLVKWGLTSI